MAEDFQRDDLRRFLKYIGGCALFVVITGAVLVVPQARRAYARFMAPETLRGGYEQRGPEVVPEPRFLPQRAPLPNPTERAEQVLTSRFVTVNGDGALAEVTNSGYQAHVVHLASYRIPERRSDYRELVRTTAAVVPPGKTVRISMGGFPGRYEYEVVASLRDLVGANKYGFPHNPYVLTSRQF